MDKPKKMISLQRKLNLGLKMEEKKEAKIRGYCKKKNKTKPLLGNLFLCSIQVENLEKYY
jgi:hypothetical protein